ncbi:hypothetical protein G7Y89_g9314 [Cudoniella acicularis]|uniref:RNase III domain-containing protein n=1 Tax=Cudoniella acicularis TaxID=354080 RepID=A0A8H4RIL2_9HELO|nr:hypothetical protein G7Y89_g9314 [Cudoniella acicularis]
MALRTATRPLRSFIRRARPVCECSNSISSRTASIRQISSSSRCDAKWETDPAERPRWSYTPEEMKAPYPWKPVDPKKVFECNNDPEKLDRFYVNLLGPGGDRLLSEEVKWLAITHKSFDQGRRGFNDRLAFFGRRILNLQTNLALVQSHSGTQTQSALVASDGRQPFTHPALEGLANLSKTPIGEVLTKTRLANLATQLGMREIIRWRPRNIDKLDSSGIDVVLNTGIYAIIGAIALQRGGAVAAQIAREKVLAPLGILYRGQESNPSSQFLSISTGNYLKYLRVPTLYVMAQWHPRSRVLRSYHTRPTALKNLNNNDFQPRLQALETLKTNEITPWKSTVNTDIQKLHGGKVDIIQYNYDQGILGSHIKTLGDFQTRLASSILPTVTNRLSELETEIFTLKVNTEKDIQGVMKEMADRDEKMTKRLASLEKKSEQGAKEILDKISELGTKVAKSKTSSSKPTIIDDTRERSSGDWRGNFNSPRGMNMRVDNFGQLSFQHSPKCIGSCNCGAATSLTKHTFSPSTMIPTILVPYGPPTPPILESPSHSRHRPRLLEAKSERESVYNYNRTPSIHVAVSRSRGKRGLFGSGGEKKEGIFVSVGGE